MIKTKIINKMGINNTFLRKVNLFLVIGLILLGCSSKKDSKDSEKLKIQKSYNDFYNNLLSIAKNKIEDPLAKYKDSAGLSIITGINNLSGKDFSYRIHTNYYNGENFFITNSDTFLGWMTNDFSIFTFPVEFSDFTFWTDNYTFLVSNALFRKTVKFESNNYPTNFVVSNCFFEEKLIFLNGDTINQPISFFSCFLKEGLSFNEEVNTNYMDSKEKNLVAQTFNNDVIFSNCNLFGSLDFRGCKFTKNSNLIFFNCNLPDTLVLSEIKTDNIVDLTKTSIKGKEPCYIDISRMDIKKIKMQYTNFKLIFSKEISEDEKSSVYELLLQNFKDYGFNDSYKKLEIEYKDMQSANNLSLKLSKIWWNHGYSKSRILLWTIGILIIFSFFNFIFFNQISHAFKVEKINFGSLGFVSNPYMKAFKQFILVFFYTGFIFFKLGIDFNKIDFSKVSVVIFIIFQYVIGLVCTGFIINYFIKI